MEWEGGGERVVFMPLPLGHAFPGGLSVVPAGVIADPSIAPGRGAGRREVTTHNCSGH